MKKRTLVFLIISAAIVAAAIIYSLATKDDSNKPLETEVKLGQFEILVTVTGELQAETSTDIMAPLLLRSRELRIRNIKIQDLVAEGTVVDSGDYVATLDRSEADNSYKDISDELEVRESEYTKTKLDTTMGLRELRDEMINLNLIWRKQRSPLSRANSNHRLPYVRPRSTLTRQSGHITRQ